MYRTVAMTAV